MSVRPNRLRKRSKTTMTRWQNGCLENCRPSTDFVRQIDLLADGDDQRRTVWPPFITESESQRRDSGCPITIRQIGLPELFERRYRSEIIPAVANVPFIALEVAGRNSGVILHTH